MKIEFWSSTEYSGFLAGLMRELSDSGLHATQRYHISEASYRSAKSAPARLFLRFRQYVAYTVQLIAALGWRKLKAERGNTEKHLTSDSCALSSELDVCVVSTNTFYAPLLATYLHPNVVHLVYDLFPEAMIHSGKWQEGTLKVKVVRWITKQTLKRAKQNVFLGQRLKDYVESIHGPVANSAIIAVGADQSLFRLSPKQRLMKAETLKAEILKKGPKILYCGNFGNMHDSETLFEYWKQCRSDTPVALESAKEKRQECRFYFFCSGPKRVALEEALSALPDVLTQQIHLGGGLDQAAWIETMESADVALVTMTPGAEEVVMPSKTYSAMMAGQAILAIAPEDSDLVDTIKAAECGWFVEPGDVAGLEKALEVIAHDPEGLLKKRQHAFQYAHKHFGQDALAKQWLDVVERL